MASEKRDEAPMSDPKPPSAASNPPTLQEAQEVFEAAVAGDLCLKWMRAAHVDLQSLPEAVSVTLRLLAKERAGAHVAGCGCRPKCNRPTKPAHECGHVDKRCSTKRGGKEK